MSDLEGVALDDTSARATGGGFRNPAILQRALATRAAKRNINSVPIADYSSDVSEVSDEIDNATDVPTENPTPKRRGRPKGTAKSKTNENSLRNIEKALIAIHFIAATRLNIDEIKLEQDDAHTIAEAVADVAKYYNIKIDGKTGAWLNLTYALGSVYAPMGVLLYMRMKEQKANGSNS